MENERNGQDANYAPCPFLIGGEGLTVEKPGCAKASIPFILEI